MSIKGFRVKSGTTETIEKYDYRSLDSAPYFGAPLFESGSISDDDGVTKTTNSKRLRVVTPIFVRDLGKIIIPQGYRCYIYQLDVNLNLISRSGWYQTITRNILDDDCVYLNMLVRKQDAQDSDISSYATYIDNNIVVQPYDDLLALETDSVIREKYVLPVYLYGIAVSSTSSKFGSVNTNAKRVRSPLFNVKKGDILKIRGDYLFSVICFDDSGNVISSSYDNCWWLWNDNYYFKQDCIAIVVLAHSTTGLETGTFTNDFTNAEIASIFENGVIELLAENLYNDYSYSAISVLDDGYYIYGNSDSSSKGYIRISQNYTITDFIPVQNGDEFILSGATRSNTALITGYDANHVPISVIEWFVASTMRLYLNEKFTIDDENIKFIRCSFNIENGQYPVKLSVSKEVKDRIDNYNAIPSNAVKMFTDDIVIGQLKTGQNDSSQTIINTESETSKYRLSANEILGLPFGKKTKILIKLKDTNYVVGFRFGDYVYHMDMSPSSYLHDGDVVDVGQIPTVSTVTNPNYYTFTIGFPIFQYAPGNTDSTAKKMTLEDIAKAGLELYAINEDFGTDSDGLIRLSSSKLSETVYGVDSYRYTDSNNLVIFHTTDPHGDYYRIKRFMEMADKCGADIAAITGDIVSYNPYSGFGWFHDIVNKCSVLPAICTGNHDVYATSWTDQNVYETMFAPISSKLGMTGTNPYYYIDIESKKIRSISINLYDYDGQTTVSTRAKTHFSQAQINWLISTLLSTPDGYGVIILEHSPQRPVRNLKNGSDTFYQYGYERKMTGDGTSSNVNGAPVYDIIDAFLSRGQISKTYPQTSAPDFVIATADFSSVSSDVEFVCFLSGHIHEDSICYVPDADHKLLVLNPVCTTPFYGKSQYPYLADDSDICRDVIGPSQDAYNVYVIDRLSKMIKVTRIGANVTFNGRDRKYMEISYTDWTETVSTVANGSVTNPSNQNAVNTSNYTPIQNGKIAFCDVTRHNTEGYHYVYGYAIYDSQKNQIAYSDYSAKKTSPYVEISDPDASFIRFAIVEYTSDGSARSLRVGDFSENDITVKVSR